MRKNDYNLTYKPVLFRGYVYYEDMTPVKNAVVLLEKVYKNANLQNEDSIYYDYTITNKFGEFCFQIFDTTHYYKIKIFDNQDFN